MYYCGCRSWWGHLKDGRRFCLFYLHNVKFLKVTSANCIMYVWGKVNCGQFSGHPSSCVSHRLQLKRECASFEAGLYEVLVPSQCTTCSRQRSGLTSEVK